MRFIIFFPLLLLSYYLNAQKELSVFGQESNEGYIIYANNYLSCPISVKLNLTLENLTFSEPMDTTFVIPPNNEYYKLGELKYIESWRRYRYYFNYSFIYGDVFVTDYDKDFAYTLPFMKGESFRVSQGYFGLFSHKKIHALDFTMPEGTPIVAARSGIVVKVVENNKKGCSDESCIKYNNLVLVFHLDGTFANYLHVKHKGAKVKVGDVINEGDIIAYSGNTGFSSKPHLHFECFLPAFNNFAPITKSIPTKFKIDDGEEAITLTANNVYFRNY